MFFFNDRILEKSICSCGKDNFVLPLAVCYHKRRCHLHCHLNYLLGQHKNIFGMFVTCEGLVGSAGYKCDPLLFPLCSNL